MFSFIGTKLFVPRIETLCSSARNTLFIGSEHFVSRLETTGHTLFDQFLNLFIDLLTHVFGRNLVEVKFISQQFRIRHIY